MLRSGSNDDNSRSARVGRTDLAGASDPAGSEYIGTGTTTLAADREMCSLIQDEIIPRLVAAHRLDETSARPRIDLAGPTLSRMDPELVADQAMDSDASGLMLMLESAMARGADIESLLIDVLAPAARCLGTRWEQDTADFIDVTMGLWRLQEVVHELTGRDGSNGRGDVATDNARSILCAVAPGDDHSFGSVILEEFFRRAGWRSASCRSTSRAELLSTLVAEWYDLVALTVTVEQPSGSLANLVEAIRAASRNPAVSIMVGGRLFSEQPGLADAVGADATAGDARGALSKAERLVGQRQVGDRLPRVSGAPPGQQPLRRGIAPG